MHMLIGKADDVPGDPGGDHSDQQEENGENWIWIAESNCRLHLRERNTDTKSDFNSKYLKNNEYLLVSTKFSVLCINSKFIDKWFLKNGYYVVGVKKNICCNTNQRFILIFKKIYQTLGLHKISALNIFDSIEKFVSML